MSLYVYYERGDYFFPYGRFSWNPRYRKKGRAVISNIGCIARGWDKGWHFDADVPEPAHDAKEYFAKEYSFPRAVYRKLRMPSRLYAVRKISDEKARGLAVIVVESTKSSAFQEDELRDALDNIANQFAVVIRDLAAYLPDPSLAEGIA